MANRIIICGMNCSGKSTLGKALSEETGWTFRDAEDYFFPQRAVDQPYDTARTKAEAANLLLKDLKAHDDFIFASVRGDYGDAAAALFTCAVLITVPKQIRTQRIWDRSYQKFGDRILPGGDLHDCEKHFFDMASARPESHVTEWLDSIRLPVIRIDGTLPAPQNAGIILQELAKLR